MIHRRWYFSTFYMGLDCVMIWSLYNIHGWSQKKCTRWQHCVNNDAICPAISGILLENFWKLVQCKWSTEVCVRGNDRALKWRLFVSQVPWLMTISAFIKIETLRGETPTNFCKRWLLLTKPGSGISSLNWNLSPVSGEAKVPRDR